MPSELFYLMSLDRPISNRRGFLLVFINKIFFIEIHLFNAKCRSRSDAAPYLGLHCLPMSFYGKIGIIGLNCKPLRKHAYSNILKISPPKTESFQIKILIFFTFLLKTYIMDTR